MAWLFGTQLMNGGAGTRTRPDADAFHRMHVSTSTLQSGALPGGTRQHPLFAALGQAFDTRHGHPWVWFAHFVYTPPAVSNGGSGGSQVANLGGSPSAYNGSDTMLPGQTEASSTLQKLVQFSNARPNDLANPGSRQHPLFAAVAHELIIGNFGPRRLCFVGGMTCPHWARHLGLHSKSFLPEEVRVVVKAVDRSKFGCEHASLPSSSSVWLQRAKPLRNASHWGGCSGERLQHPRFPRLAHRKSRPAYCSPISAAV